MEKGTGYAASHCAEGFSTVDVRVFPAELLAKVHQNALPWDFQSDTGVPP